MLGEIIASFVVFIVAIIIIAIWIAWDKSRPKIVKERKIRFRVHGEVRTFTLIKYIGGEIVIRDDCGGIIADETSEDIHILKPLTKLFDIDTANNIVDFKEYVISNK